MNFPPSNRLQITCRPWPRPNLRCLLQLSPWILLSIYTFCTPTTTITTRNPIATFTTVNHDAPLPGNSAPSSTLLLNLIPNGHPPGYLLVNGRPSGPTSSLRSRPRVPPFRDMLKTYIFPTHDCDSSLLNTRHRRHYHIIMCIFFGPMPTNLSTTGS